MPPGSGRTGASQAGHASVPVAICHELSSWRSSCRPARRSTLWSLKDAPASMSRCNATETSLGRTRASASASEILARPVAGERRQDRDFIAAYNRRDFDAAVEFFDPDIEWVLPAPQRSDSCQGPDEIKRFWQGLDETFDELRLTDWGHALEAAGIGE
jgi:hypothetical protein